MQLVQSILPRLSCRHELEIDRGVTLGIGDPAGDTQGVPLGLDLHKVPVSVGA